MNTAFPKLKPDEFRALDWARTHAFSGQRAFASALGFSLGKANAMLRCFSADGWLAPDHSLTAAGLAQLAPHKVDNAVIMAAGMSSRFAPLSYEKPKGVLKVKGEILIERQIRQLHEAGIRDITVVVGYMKEQFFYLQEKFGVALVVNEDYHRFNNPSSLFRVRDRLRNTYVCSSDNYFSENVFEPYVYRAYYAASFFPGPSQEWGLVADSRGRIVGIDHSPVDRWCMMGHAYFDRDFSARFVRLLEDEYASPLTRQNLWEALFERHLDVLSMDIRRYPGGVIHEFDSLEELRAFDSRYLGETDSAIFSNICSVLRCKESDIDRIEVLKQGLTNLSFKFSVGGRSYVYRHPGFGTESWISRASEAFSLAAAKKLGLDPTVIHIDPVAGWKLSSFIENARPLDCRNPDDLRSAARLMRRLHDARIPSPHAIGLWDRIGSFVRQTTAAHKNFPDYAALHDRMASLHARWHRESPPPVLCHGDCRAANFLAAPDGSVVLLDWECSAAFDPGFDIGTFICCSDFSPAEAESFLALYHGRPPAPAELRHDFASIALAAWYWFVWSVFQESIGNPAGRDTLNLYRMAKTWLERALPEK